VNNNKVTDHHALLPTETNPNSVNLPPDADKIYDLIVTRFLAAFSPPCEKEVTQLDFLSGGLLFKASGSVILVPGWRAIEAEIKEKEDDAGDENQKLPKVYQGDELPVTDPAVIKKMTKAKPVHTESSLLKLMETAGKELDDDELRQAIKDCGIGTPATRASVIETLFERKYIEREKKKIIPTEKGLQVYELVKDQPIASVSMTGNWEKALNLIAEGKRNYSQFIVGIHTYTNEVVSTLKQAGLTMPGAQNPRVEIIEVGKIGENVIKAGKGQYGTFIIYQEKFYNVAGKEPNEVTLEVALAAMEAKQVQDKERAVQREKNLIAKVGKKYEIRNGQYGLYVTDGKINASLPKNITPEIAATWKADQCKETIAAYLEWKKKKEVAKG
jgi:hypothetical protein